MIFSDTGLEGALRIDLDRHEDRRGWFARTFCENEFAARGLPTRFVQTNLSFTRRAGTLRGLHWQASPHAEDKLVRCLRGAIWDAIVDLRPGSPTFGRWIGITLDDVNQRMLLVPRGFAHGFVTLCDETFVHYQMSTPHVPEAARGARHDDPAFRIEWPVPVTCVSDRDRNWPAYTLTVEVDET